MSALLASEYNEKELLVLIEVEGFLVFASMLIQEISNFLKMVIVYINDSFLYESEVLT